MSETAPKSTTAWWTTGVIYQVYLRSYADSNADGIGDIQGLVSRLPYIEGLGVDAVLLSPLHPSPNTDWGYDVADYRAVAPEYGTIKDFKDLLKDLHHRNLRLLLDLVPGHTSDAHPWFVDSSSSRSSAHRNWYVWVDGSPDQVPNNWLNAVGVPAWTWHEPTRAWYLHNYLATQPDLNWWNSDVREEFESIIRFWLGLGVDGFRIDVAHGVVKDQLLRDNPPATVFDNTRDQGMKFRHYRNTEQPAVHDIYRKWHEICDQWGERLLLGETYVLDTPRLARFYGDNNDELHLCQNVQFPLSPFSPEALKAIVGASEAVLPRGAWPTTFISNHDLPRAPGRWAPGDSRRARCALLALLTIRGTPTLYYGDELLLEDALSATDGWLLDPIGRLVPPGRDGCRQPMPWTDAPNNGFCPPEVRPWNRRVDSATSVESQTLDSGSDLNFARSLLHLRRSLADLTSGGYHLVECPADTWVWARGQSTVVAINLGAVPLEMTQLSGVVRLSTEVERGQEQFSDRLIVHPGEGVVLELHSEPGSIVVSR